MDASGNRKRRRRVGRYAKAGHRASGCANGFGVIAPMSTREVVGAMRRKALVIT